MDNYIPYSMTINPKVTDRRDRITESLPMLMDSKLGYHYSSSTRNAYLGPIIHIPSRFRPRFSGNEEHNIDFSNTRDDFYSTSEEEHFRHFTKGKVVKPSTGEYYGYDQAYRYNTKRTPIMYTGQKDSDGNPVYLDIVPDLHRNEE